MRSGGWQEFVSYLPASYECEESAAAISSLEKVTQVKSDTWCQHYSQQPPAAIWLLVFHNFDIDVYIVFTISRSIPILDTFSNKCIKRFLNA